MKALLVSHYFWPEAGCTAANLMTDMAESLTQNGHEVTVLTTFPNYPGGEIYSDYRGRWFQREEFRGIRIIRTWLYATPRTHSIWQRALSQFSFGVTLLVGALFTPKADVVLNYSPPLPSAFSACLVSILKRARFVVSLQDLEPERSIKLGILRNNWLVRILHWVEAFIYRHSDTLCVLSPGTRQHLIEKGVPEFRIKVTPNWADGDLIRPASRETHFREQWGLKDEFIVLYGGNMGYTMDLETVIDAARLLRNRQDIVFLFVGDGVKRAKLEHMASGLENVHFKPTEPIERFSLVLASSDVALVVISQVATHVSVPSKTYGIMAAARPVIALCSAANEVSRVVEQAGCGARVEPGDAEGLAQTIRGYADDPRRVIGEGEKGRAYFDSNFTREIGTTNYERVLIRAAGKSA